MQISKNTEQFKSRIQNLESNKNWKKLNNFLENIDISFYKLKNFNDDLQVINKNMFENICDDTWMGHCAKYQLKSGGKRFRAILALLASKIFELISLSIPIFFLGYGEASDLIRNWKVGYVSDPKDFKSLEKNIKKMTKSNLEYLKLQSNCMTITKSELNYNLQFNKLLKLLK